MNKKRVLIILLSLAILLVLAGIIVLIMTNIGKNDDTVSTDTSIDITSPEYVPKITVTTETTTEETTTEVLTTTEQGAAASETDAISGGKAFEFRERTLSDDTEAPIFLWCPSSVTIEQGKGFTLWDYIGYADDVDRDLDLETEGSVDSYTVGSYPLHLTITDDTGKSAEADMTVEVVEEIPASDDSDYRESFSDFAANYGGEDVSLGIDVSRWQEDIDYEAVKAAGCEFVIIRLGGYDDGELYTDSYYHNNIQNAKAAGLKVGIYWHAEESSVEEVQNSVDYIMQVLDGETLDFPIAYDWEDFIGFQYYGMNLYDVNACFEAFCDAVEAEGYKVCNYGSKSHLINAWTNDEAHPIWLAHYTDETDYAGDYYMWQHSCWGDVPGIDGYVDLDILYK